MFSENFVLGRGLVYIGHISLCVNAGLSEHVQNGEMLQIGHVA